VNGMYNGAAAASEDERAGRGGRMVLQPRVARPVRVEHRSEIGVELRVKSAFSTGTGAGTCIAAGHGRVVGLHGALERERKRERRGAHAHSGGGRARGLHPPDRRRGRVGRAPRVVARATARSVAVSVSVTDLPAFEAVLDIEDMRTVWICGVARPRPPIVPFLCPFRVHLEPGKVYRYCTCGRSESQPFCDDEHGDTDPQPIEFSVDVNQSWHLICGCKYSTSPFCDGFD